MATINQSSKPQRTRWQLLLAVLGDSLESFSNEETISEVDELDMEIGIRDSVHMTRTRLGRVHENTEDHDMPTGHDLVDGTQDSVQDNMPSDDDIMDDIRDSLLLNQRRLQRMKIQDETSADTKNSISSRPTALPDPEKPNGKFARQA